MIATRFPGIIGDRRRPRRRRPEEMSVTDALRQVPADAPSFTPKPAAATGPQRALGTTRPPATDAARFTGPMTALRAPAAFVPGAEPPEDDPRGLDPYAGQPQPALARPYTVPRESEPVHQSVLADLGTPRAAVTLPPPPPPPGFDVLPYTEPGWVAKVAEMRLRDGEWEDLPAIVERGYGIVAAGAAGGYRHSRETIARGARQLCAAIGQPELARVLLNRVADLNKAAREAAEGGAR